jgi:predicted Zn-dependent protease
MQRWKRTAAVCAVVCAGCGTPEERAETARQEVREALSRGEVADALDTLAKLRDVQPETPEAILEYAELLVRAGEAAQAVWVLQASLGRFPDRHELRLALGRAALLVSDPALARAVLAEVPAGSDHHPMALLTLSQAELQLGDLASGLAVIARAEALYPDLPGLRAARIATLLGEQRLDEARAALAEAKALETREDGRAALRRVETALHAVALRAGHTDAAIAGLTALVEEDPGDALAWQPLVLALALAGQVDRASLRLRAAIEADPARYSLYSLLASVELLQGRAGPAEALLRELLRRSPSPAAHLGLARFYTAQRDEARAAAAYAAALAAFPDEPLLRFHRAEALLGFGRVDEAAEEVRRFRDAQPRDDPHAEYLRARVELARGDAAAAKARLERLAPRLDQAATQFWLGRALESLGDRAGAERRYGLAMIRPGTDALPFLEVIHLARSRGDWRAVAGYAEMMRARLPYLLEGWTADIAARIQLGRASEAEALARHAVAIFAASPEPRLLLAEALRARGRVPDALVTLDALERELGSSDRLAAQRVLTLGSAGQPQALERAREAAAAHPGSAVVQLALAQLLFTSRDAAAGSAAVDRALSLAPDDPMPLRVRAEFRAASGDFAGSLADCESYLALRPDDGRVRFVQAVALEAIGRRSDAAAAYRRAAELDPRAFEPRNNLAGLLAADGDLDGALEAAQAAYALAGDDPHVMDTLGALYLRKGRVDRAVSLLEDAHAEAPQLADAQLHLAQAYQAAGRTDEARRLLADLERRGALQPDLRAAVEETLHSLR